MVGGAHPDLFEDVTMSAHTSGTHFARSMRATINMEHIPKSRRPQPRSLDVSGQSGRQESLKESGHRRKMRYRSYADEGELLAISSNSPSKMRKIHSKQECQGPIEFTNLQKVKVPGNSQVWRPVREPGGSAVKSLTDQSGRKLNQVTSRRNRKEVVAELPIQHKRAPNPQPPHQRLERPVSRKIVRSCCGPLVSAVGSRKPKTDEWKEAIQAAALHTSKDSCLFVFDL
ncbi:uncharacterized protein LOC134437168 [Engraulis encrasicolus]|uniref:uncharacterized protein LOC134437168 n=1 Tax=Engraulis encrasicolus TaxID=184585 RepID=UPI002FD2FD26